MSHVYSARLRFAHHDLDAFGRAYPAAYLRQLAAIAVDASTAAGFDARWYATHGVHWLVRRTSFELHAPATAADELEARTWVEDFRRVRSQRRYELRTTSGRPVLDAATDWVLVESATGKLRRIPEEMERGFGTAAPVASEPRRPWAAPPEPASVVRAACALRYTDLDALMHVNNAAYLDLLLHGALDALATHGWGFDRLLAAGAAPLCVAADVEYLDAARFGDRLELVTWFTPAAETLGVHQRIERGGDARPLVRATARWQWLDPATRTPVATPAQMAGAIDASAAA